ncbi:RNA polymerase sigma factor [candidate division WOR-3 bacterium]|nr:RNA polymerase sigma factor [candidate division WOR-3 bacterium]
MKQDWADVSELVKRAQGGDESAMSELIATHKQLIFTITNRMVHNRDTAMDLTQDTFIKAFLNIKRVKSGKHFRPWLCRIARNVTYDYFRKEKLAHQVTSIEDIQDYVGTTPLEQTRRSMIIQDALDCLAPKDRMLLTLAYYEGFTHHEISEVMDIPAHNVKVQIHRARLRLRKELQGREHELMPI